MYVDVSVDFPETVHAPVKRSVSLAGQRLTVSVGSLRLAPISYSGMSVRMCSCSSVTWRKNFIRHHCASTSRPGWSDGLRKEIINGLSTNEGILFQWCILLADLDTHAATSAHDHGS